MKENFKPILNQFNSYQLFWGLVLASCVIKLYLSSALFLVVSYYSSHDMRWFYQQSYSLASGNWMGEYGHMALIKFPMFSIFLSWVSKLGISAKLTFDLLYISSCIVFLVAIIPLISNRVVSFFAFLILLFFPISFSDYWSILSRELLFIPMLILYLSLATIIIQRICTHKTNIVWPCFWLGICFAIAALTREESIWLKFITFILIALMIIFMWRHKLLALVGIVIMLTPFLYLNHSLSKKNYEHYGFYGLTDFNAPQYSRAYDAILTLNTDNDGTYRYLTFDVRDKLIEISENTRELILPLLNEDGTYQNLITGINGGFASFSIRTSMRHNGYYESFDKAEAQYKLIADDIENYCENNPSQCRPLIISKLLIKKLSFSTMFDSILLKLQDLITLRPLKYNFDRTSVKNNFDFAWDYSIGRYFNMFSFYEPEYETKLDYLKQRRINKLAVIQNIYEFYSTIFKYMLLFSFVIASITLFQKNKLSHKLVNLGLFGSFLCVFFIHTLVTLYAVNSLNRLLIISLIPLLLFTVYNFAYGVNIIIDLVYKKMLRRFL